MLGGLSGKRERLIISNHRRQAWRLSGDTAYRRGYSYGPLGVLVLAALALTVRTAFDETLSGTFGSGNCPPVPGTVLPTCEW